MENNHHLTFRIDEASIRLRGLHYHGLSNYANIGFLPSLDVVYEIKSILINIYGSNGVKEVLAGGVFGRLRDNWCHSHVTFFA